MTVIAIPRILQEKLTAEGAEALVDIINKADERSKENIIEVAEERFEKRLAQLEVKIENVRADLIKWMFIFWAGQVTVITAILLAIVKK